MKFLIDANVSYALSDALRNLEYEVISAVERFPSKTPDTIIFETAIKERAILITRDHDFTNPVKYPPAKTKGIIFIRIGNLRSEEEVTLILNALNQLDAEMLNGKLVTVYKNNIRIL